MKLIRREKQDRGAVTRGQGGGAPNLELNRLRQQIDSLFEDPFSLLAPGTSFFEGWTPPVDVFEDKDKYVLRAEIPGMKKEDIEVSLDGNTLTISGERTQEEEKKEGETYRAERFFGRFQRSITLPASVQADKIEASYKDGVLTIRAHKSEEAKPKQIAVKS
jgi:HSP20 family protein